MVRTDGARVGFGARPQLRRESVRCGRASRWRILARAGGAAASAASAAARPHAAARPAAGTVHLDARRSFACRRIGTAPAAASACLAGAAGVTSGSRGGPSARARRGRRCGSTTAMTRRVELPGASPFGGAAAQPVPPAARRSQLVAAARPLRAAAAARPGGTSAAPHSMRGVDGASSRIGDWCVRRRHQAVSRLAPSFGAAAGPLGGEVRGCDYDGAAGSAASGAAAGSAARGRHRLQ